MYWGVDVQVHILLTTVVAGSEWSNLRHGSHSISGERTKGIHWIGGLGGLQNRYV
jgi:hypothetical protein